MKETSSIEKRIDYFDLMKGVCIIFVILHHCDVLHSDMLRCIRMPLYFMLSGMFFKKYSGFVDFSIKKVNKLLIPYGTFMLLSLAIFHRINVPLWFLISLFYSYILYYIIEKWIIDKFDSWYINIVLFVVLSLMAYCLSFVHLNNKILNIVLRYFVISLATMPYFFFSQSLRKKGILSKIYSNQFLIVVGIVGAAICYFSSVHSINYRKALFEAYPLYYICAIGGVMAIWALCYKIKRLPYVSYMGRYSIIVLVTHFPVIMLMKELHMNNWIITAFILILSPLLISLLKRYAPHITAQKDIIQYNKDTRKIRFVW